MWPSLLRPMRQMRRWHTLRAQAQCSWSSQRTQTCWLMDAPGVYAGCARLVEGLYSSHHGHEWPQRKRSSLSGHGFTTATLTPWPAQMLMKSTLMPSACAFTPVLLLSCICFQGSVQARQDRYRRGGFPIRLAQLPRPAAVRLDSGPVPAAVCHGGL